MQGLRRAGRWELQLCFTRCTTRCIEACVAKGAATEAARVAHQFRDDLVSPWFHDDLIERYVRAKADTMRTALGARVGAWLAAHPDIAAKGAGRIVEPYDFADQAETQLWNGALRIRLPRRYVPERQSSVRFECDEPGVDCPTISFEVANVASAVGRNAADAARDAQSCLRTAAMAGRGQYRHMLREVPGSLLPGIFSQYDCQDGEDGDEVRDWLVARNWFLLRASRSTVFILGVGIVSAAFQEGRDDVRGFILQLERALGDMTIDADRPCREAGLE
ncbi:MAG: hypothetical protein JNL66_18450 [Alphaproteobacteria bacterium]|nr:hypothetical protein [Alphaproteobacteria bacterium]